MEYKIATLQLLLHHVAICRLATYSGGPFPLGLYSLSVVSKILSRRTPSSLCHRCSVCNPGSTTSIVAIPPWVSLLAQLHLPGAKPVRDVTGCKLQISVQSGKTKRAEKKFLPCFQPSTDCVTARWCNAISRYYQRPSPHFH
jgi:hypothetical protein